MMDFSNCSIKQIAIHQVGNKANDEELFISKELIELDENLRDLLSQYFLNPFQETEFYNFTFTDNEFELNPIYNYASEVFNDTDSFYINTVKLAKHLYEITNHPNIKSGDLFIVEFEDIEVDGVYTSAIGIFKSENKQSFIKVNYESGEFIIDSESGINIDKLDKGCLIFNQDSDKGFKVTIVDKSNRSYEAQYWKESFLNLRPCSDSFHHTKDFLEVTKQYLTKQLSKEFEVEKTDKIDMLNRSVDYFKNNDSFSKDSFEEEVFKNDESVIQSFRSFDQSYRENHEMDVVEDFEISDQAVKKQARAFKSVLKLDKNFHIYIHGDKSKIESGVDRDGRKFYKIYYDEEQ